jgi:hypothetical protein
MLTANICASTTDVLVPSQHLCTEVLLGILDVELLGDGHTVVADDG